VQKLNIAKKKLPFSLDENGSFAIIIVLKRADSLLFVY